MKIADMGRRWEERKGEARVILAWDMLEEGDTLLAGEVSDMAAEGGNRDS